MAECQLTAIKVTGKYAPVDIQLVNTKEEQNQSEMYNTAIIFNKNLAAEFGNLQRRHTSYVTISRLSQERRSGYILKIGKHKL